MRLAIPRPILSINKKTYLNKNIPNIKNEGAKTLCEIEDLIY